MESLLTRRSIYILLLLGFVTSVLLFVVSVTQQQTETRSKAAPATALSLTVDKSLVAVGDEVVVSVNIDTGHNQVAGADITINFDSTVFSGTHFDSAEFLPTVFTPGTITGGSARIVLASSPTSPQRGTGTLARLYLRAIAPSNQTNIAFAGSTAVAAIGEGGRNVISSLTNTSVTVVAAPTNPVADTGLSFYPQTLTVTTGDHFYLPLHINTGSNQVAGADLAITYDDSKLQGVSMAVGGFLPTILSSQGINQGVAKIVLGSLVQSPAQGEGVLVVLEFVARSSGTTSVVIDPSTRVSAPSSSQNILKSLSNATISINAVMVTPTPSPQAVSCGASVPTNPHITSVIATDSTSINLSWNPVNVPLTHYGLVYGVQSGVYLYGASNVGNVNSFTISGLSPKTTYYFSLFAINDCATSGYSNEVSATTLAVTNQATGNEATIKASPVTSSVYGSFVALNPNEDAIPFLSQKNSPVSPLPRVSVPPEAETSTSGSTSFLPNPAIILLLIVILITGFVLFYYMRKE